ncbi:MAG: AAA family ATPase [Patescibacteria group bacterium]
MRLVFFGGVHGVGKTSLLEKISSVSDEKPFVVDLGELFWEHVYRMGDKTSDEVEELAMDEIEMACRAHSIVICNWHYAVWTPEGYIPQIALSRLASLVDRIRPECARLVLVKAPARVVFKRRTRDRAIKKRKISLACIEEEMAQTEHFYRLHHDVLSPQVKTLSSVFDNTGPINGAAIKRLGKILHETS